MKNSQQYNQYKRPSWAPSSKVFGPVWTVLYVSIIITYGYVLKLSLDRKISFIIVLPFLLNLVFNLLYTPIEFGLKSMKLATVDIFLVLGTLVWAIVDIYQYAHWISYALIPYLVWVLFATVLQLAILNLNR